MINKTIKKYPIIKEMFLYGLIGGTSALLDALLFIVLRKIGLQIYVSNFISINAGIALSFVLNTYFNFKKTDNLKKRAVSFFSVGYIGLLLSFLILYIFVTKMNFNEVVIKLFSIVFVAAVQFVLNKLFTYGSKGNIIDRIDIKSINNRRLLLYTAFLLLLILFVPVVVSLIGFLINISISAFHFIISTVLSIIILTIYSNKKGELKEGILSIILSIILLTISILLTWNLYDFSYDGVNYHLHSVISLTNGWNPIKEVLKTGYYADMNANYFAAKGVWYYSASIAKLFNNLNVTKTYIFLSTFVSFLLVYYVILETKLINKMSNMFNFMISLFIVFNPVIMYQYMTNYTDVYMSNLILILVFSLLYITKNNDNKIISIIAMISIMIMGNIKVTGIFFAFIFCAFYFVLWCYQAFKTKNIKNLIDKTLPLILAGILIFFIGLNPYFTNIKNGKNMFHPVLGKEKIDLVGANCPVKLQNRNNLKQITYSIISTVNNYVEEEKYVVKNPLRIEKEEFVNTSFDIRLGGWGALFFLIVIISMIFAIFIIINYYKNKKNKKKTPFNLILTLYTFITIILVALIFPDAWWARYYPVIWILPLLLLIMSTYVFENKRIISYVAIVVMGLMICNNAILYYSTTNFYNDQNAIMTEELSSCKNNECIVLTSKGLFGFTVTEMFKRNNSKIELVDSIDYDWDYDMWLMKTKVIEKE